MMNALSLLAAASRGSSYPREPGANDGESQDIQALRSLV